jgi:hypothetical protein
MKDKRRILSLWLFAVVLLFPLLFFPGVRNFVSGAKNFFLIFAALIGLLLWVADLLSEKRPIIVISKWNLIIGLFSLISLFWLIFVPAGVRVSSLINPIGVGTFLALFVLSFLLIQVKDQVKPRRWFVLLSSSAAVLVLLEIILFLLPEGRYPLKFPAGAQNPVFSIINPRWSPLGSVFELAIFLLPLLVYWLLVLIKDINRRQQLKNKLAVVFSMILLVGFGLAMYQMVKNRPNILSYKESWSIAAESFKRQPLKGVGLGNFLNAFSSYRTIRFNQSNAWAIRFNQSGSFLLHLWTETGIIGLGLWLAGIWHLWQVRKESRQRGKKRLWSVFLTLLALQVFLPINLGLLFLIFLVFSIADETTALTLPDWAWLKRALAAVIVILVVAVGWLVGKAFWADWIFVKGVRAVAENRGGDAYRLQLQAVKTNRFVADYRIARSQLDLALANSLASKKKEDITDQDRQQITLLIQEAINEAKAAVSLRPQNVIAWENLASVYRQVINLAKGADQWAVAAYQQAIALDPFNPQLRINLGSIYYGLKNYEQAARAFEAAANLKPDLANAWYNWAWSLKQQGRTAEAVGRLQQAVALVDPKTSDYERASSELESWKKELGEQQKKAQAQKKEAQVLKKPEPLPSPKLKEPIKLPKEAAPEIKVTPTPGEEPTPTVTATPTVK